MKAIVITEKELEELKQQLKKELQEEFKTKICDTPLKEAKKKWFYGGRKSSMYGNKYTDSIMEKEFGSPVNHRIWENVRNLTKIIFDKSDYRHLVDIDTEIADYVCDRICATIYTLRKCELVQRELGKQK